METVHGRNGGCDPDQQRQVMQEPPAPLELAALSRQFEVDQPGIMHQVDLTTDVGVLTLDGDMENADDGHDKIALSGARTLTAKSLLTLDSTTGGIVRSGLQPLTLKAEAGILLNDHFLGMNSIGQDLNIIADSDADGSGTFTLLSGKTVTSNDGALRI